MIRTERVPPITGQIKVHVTPINIQHNPPPTTARGWRRNRPMHKALNPGNTKAA